MVRVSSRKRLPIGHAAGTPPKWQHGDGTWAALEAAYEHALMDSVRNAIVAAVKKYFEDEPFGRNAPFAQDAVTLLEVVEKFSKQIHSAKLQTGGAARIFAVSVLKDELDDIRLRRLDCIIDRASDLAVAARAAISEIKAEDYPAFRENDAWKAMIRRLSKSFRDHGMLCTTNTMKVSTGGGASPFVAFIFALQKTFPAELQRHQHSLAALNKAVAAAIRPRKSADTLNE